MSAVLVAGLYSGAQAAPSALPSETAASPAGQAGSSVRHASLGREPAGPEVRILADWVAGSADNGDAPFLIVDKRHARVFVFDREARVLGSAPVLLGLARGDESVPGIGERKIADIRPHERTTPAGRFVAEPGRNLQGEDIVWIDYDAAVSMHRVRATNPRERRLERLATATAADNRISYGCINVPVAFFDTYVSPVFANGGRANVYVLPETLALADVFRGVGSPASAKAGGTRARAAHLATMR